MNIGVLAFILAAVGFFAVLIVIIVVMLWLVRRSKPGRAGVPANGQGIPGTIHSVLVTVAPRPPARFKEDNDQRRVSVQIDVDPSAGGGQITDDPIQPHFLPWGLRWSIFSKNPLRYGDLQLNMDDRDAAMAAAEQARAGGYEFVLEKPIRVVVSDPGGNGRRPQWQVVDG